MEGFRGQVLGMKRRQRIAQVLQEGSGGVPRAQAVHVLEIAQELVEIHRLVVLPQVSVQEALGVQGLQGAL
ncbi:unnamed protein product [Pararhodospirillum photometricum DSM 122]|uniref:Uncharacterized protein n=1 Tax=Pararhodospirillum photometricum DSM 122 TaxID=1150469 RepID=H6SIT3_PARPM|nr:unnamed protein product [Pararhodospirillum photometricum DSM 122]